MKKETVKWMVQILASIFTALATAWGTLTLLLVVI